LRSIFLQVLEKHHVVSTKQVEHVLAERVGQIPVKLGIGDLFTEDGGFCRTTAPLTTC
jgi:hypothetical protein